MSNHQCAHGRAPPCSISPLASALSAAPSHSLLPLQKTEEEVVAAAAKLHALQRISSADEQVFVLRPTSCCSTWLHALCAYTVFVPARFSGHMHNRASAVCHSSERSSHAPWALTLVLAAICRPQ